MKGDCKNCGAWQGLHHYETMQCPKGGYEAPIGQKQEWAYTCFEENDDQDERIDRLAARVAELEAALTEIRVSLASIMFPSPLEKKLGKIAATALLKKD